MPWSASRQQFLKKLKAEISKRYFQDISKNFLEFSGKSPGNSENPTRTSDVATNSTQLNPLKRITKPKQKQLHLPSKMPSYGIPKLWPHWTNSFPLSDSRTPWPPERLPKNRKPEASREVSCPFLKPREVVQFKTTLDKPIGVMETSSANPLKILNMRTSLKVQ